MASVTAPLLPYLRNYLLEVVPATPANQSANKPQQPPKEEKQAKADKAAGKKNKKQAAGEALQGGHRNMRAVSMMMEEHATRFQALTLYHSLLLPR
jgi:ribosomal protein L9